MPLSLEQVLYTSLPAIAPNSDYRLTGTVTVADGIRQMQLFSLRHAIAVSIEWTRQEEDLLLRSEAHKIAFAKTLLENAIATLEAELRNLVIRDNQPIPRMAVAPLPLVEDSVIEVDFS